MRQGLKVKNKAGQLEAPENGESQDRMEPSKSRPRSDRLQGDRKGKQAKAGAKLKTAIEHSAARSRSVVRSRRGSIRATSQKRDRTSSKKKSLSRGGSQKRDKAKNKETEDSDDYQEEENEDEAYGEEEEIEEDEKLRKSLATRRGNSLNSRATNPKSQAQRSKRNQKGKEMSGYMDEEVVPRKKSRGNRMDAEFADRDSSLENSNKGQKKKSLITKKERQPSQKKIIPTGKEKGNKRNPPANKRKNNQAVPMDILTERAIMNKNKGQVKAKDSYEEAIKKLQENYAPTPLPCREKEKRVIEDFIESGLQNKGNSQTLCSFH